MSRGDQLFVPMAMINRSEEVWGADARTWRPQRWLAGNGGVPEGVRSVPGVWGNVMSFLGGPHSCIGFRFALYEYVPSPPAGARLVLTGATGQRSSCTRS
jgi:cytochrome P450